MSEHYSRALRRETRSRGRGGSATTRVDCARGCVIWIVSEESSLAAILAHHVATLGETWIGHARARRVQDAPPADLLAARRGHRDRRPQRRAGALARVRAPDSRHGRRVPAPGALPSPRRRSAAAPARLFDDPSRARSSSLRSRRAAVARARTARRHRALAREPARARAAALGAGRGRATVRRRSICPRCARPSIRAARTGPCCSASRARVAACSRATSTSSPSRRATTLVLISLADVAPGELEAHACSRAPRATHDGVPAAPRAQRRGRCRSSRTCSARAARSAVEPIRWLDRPRTSAAGWFRRCASCPGCGSACRRCARVRIAGRSSIDGAFRAAPSDAASRARRSIRRDARQLLCAAASWPAQPRAGSRARSQRALDPAPCRGSERGPLAPNPGAARSPREPEPATGSRIERGLASSGRDAEHAAASAGAGAPSRRSRELDRLREATEDPMLRHALRTRDAAELGGARACARP